MSGIHLLPLDTLIVDADPNFVLVLTRFLEEQEHLAVIGAAHSCEEATTKAKGLNPELIIISESLAEQELCHSTVEWMKHQPGSPCVIVLSDEPHRYTDALSIADAWIEKSKFRSDLLPTIHDLCAKPNRCGCAGYLFHEELASLSAK
ncbi:MAG: response regulator transcription factor [Abitibacteriaceae bacterium]|nr:response regulator transcription factor [Abditibacteriaceae bacterium]